MAERRRGSAQGMVSYVLSLLPVKNTHGQNACTQSNDRRVLQIK